MRRNGEGIRIRALLDRGALVEHKRDEEGEMGEKKKRGEVYPNPKMQLKRKNLYL